MNPPLTQSGLPAVAEQMLLWLWQDTATSEDHAGSSDANRCLSYRSQVDRTTATTESIRLAGSLQLTWGPQLCQGAGCDKLQALRSLPLQQKDL